ncbi:MAG: WbqC family protein [Oscillospiraceae bacterium]|nr:WbqC family protein [Oscillospiraceae bacterium]
MKQVAALQSNYIPWKGYFDIIHDVDLFVFYDDVQYTQRDWRNRNKIKTANGDLWLSVPVYSQNKYKQLIHEIVIDNTQNWQKKHFNSIKQSYSKTPFWNKYKVFFEYVYLEEKWTSLSELNQYLIKSISCDFLGCKTQFADSRDFASEGTKHKKLLSLVKATNADVYLSGSAAKDYIIESDYNKDSIEIIWKDYSGYPEYSQLHGEFCHNVSVLDLLFNTGDEAPYYIWGWCNK